jgi:hypothetical protein
MMQELALKQAQDGGIRRDRAAEELLKKQQQQQAMLHAGSNTHPSHRARFEPFWVQLFSTSFVHEF